MSFNAIALGTPAGGPMGPYAVPIGNQPPASFQLVAPITEITGICLLGKDKVNVLEVILTLQAQLKDAQLIIQDLQNRVERVELAPFTLPYFAAKSHFEEASRAASVPASGSLEDDVFV